MGKSKDRWLTVRRLLGQYVTSTFLLFLILSAALWYVTKLGYNYTAEVPIDVSVESNAQTVKCMAEGSGYRLFMLRNFPSRSIRLSLDEVNATESPTNKGMYIIDPLSLQNAISLHFNNIKLISIEPLPEIEPKE
ncbi:MAG: hypothetical protein LBH06_09395 [Rikenellaceae bacterium]|jgi:hypothetical protein|nr:hypothetical protein [Rikenellaceae bacterium]